MSFITQILIPYELAIAKLRIRDSYDWHQRTWQAFEKQGLKERKFLARLDEKDDAYRLLIVSAIEPQKPDWCPTDCFKSKPIPESFLKHKAYQFSLLVNPTKKVIDPHKPKVVDSNGRINRNRNSKRVPIVAREDLLAWMERKAQAGGFSVDLTTLKTLPRPREYFYKPGKASHSATQGVHYGVEFQGTLQVQDFDQFSKSFTEGIGSAKAFGFGLLLLNPLTK